VIAGVVSSFNPYAHYGAALRPRDALCPSPENLAIYPRRRQGAGFEDLTGVDLETGQRRQLRFAERHIPPAAANCFQSVPAISHDLVRSGLCQLDVACLLDPEAPAHLSRIEAIRDQHPFHGNFSFDTALFDGGGPPAGFMDLDEVMDRANIPHTFRFLDNGALSHGGLAVRERYDGEAWLQNRGVGACQPPLLPGGWPRRGAVWPWMMRALDGEGNVTFNSPRAPPPAHVSTWATPSTMWRGASGSMPPKAAVSPSLSPCLKGPDGHVVCGSPPVLWTGAPTRRERAMAGLQRAGSGLWQGSNAQGAGYGRAPTRRERAMAGLQRAGGGLWQGSNAQGAELRTPTGTL
jgi:hypothetical protein